MTRVTPPGTADPALPPPVPLPRSGEVAYSPTPAGEVEGSWNPPLAPPARRAVLRAGTSSPAEGEGRGSLRARRRARRQPLDHRRAATSSRSPVERDLSDQEVANYWVVVIEANRSRVRSGDPDLIYPGRGDRPPAGQPGRKLSRSDRSGLSRLRSTSTTDCQVPSANRPEITGIVMLGATNAGRT